MQMTSDQPVTQAAYTDSTQVSYRNEPDSSIQPCHSMHINVLVTFKFCKYLKLSVNMTSIWTHIKTSAVITSDKQVYVCTFEIFFASVFISNT